MADGTCLEQCTSNDHCYSGQVCFSDGSCKQYCQSKDECPNGQYCHLDHNVCHDKCTSDNPCHKDYKCYNGACHKQCNGRLSNDVAIGLRYYNDTCKNNQFCNK